MSRRTKDFRFNKRRICLLFFLCMVLLVSFHCTLLNAAVKKPKLNYSKETLMVGDVLNLSVSAKGNSIGNVSWTSSNETVAYLEAANRVINNPDALHKLEAEDQDHVYYLEETDEIVFVSQDGYIRTYFQPGGRDYFERQ